MANPPTWSACRLDETSALPAGEEFVLEDVRQQRESGGTPRDPPDCLSEEQRPDSSQVNAGDQDQGNAHGAGEVATDEE